MFKQCSSSIATKGGVLRIPTYLAQYTYLVEIPGWVALPASVSWLVLFGVKLDLQKTVNIIAESDLSVVF